MTRKVILFFVAGRVGRPGRVSVPPPRTVPQPVFNRHQIDLRPVFGTAPPPTTISVASRRGEGVIYRVFGTATLPTGTSVASSRGEEELPTGLRHGDHAHRYSRGIPSWRRGLLAGLRHGEPPHRYSSAISAWRSDTKPIPNRSMNGVNGWLRHGVPAPRHLRGWFCAMNRDLESSVSGKGSSYGSEHRERISSPCNSGFIGKFCLRYRLHFIIFASECSEYIRGTRKRQEHLRANRRRTGNAIREGSGLCYRQN